MIKRHRGYPITVSTVIDHPESISKIFFKAKPHKGAFIGVSLLDFILMDDTDEMYISLDVGERLELKQEHQSDRMMLPITAVRADGTYVGTLPLSDSLLPDVLMSRRITVYAFVEAKEACGGTVKIAVSIYSERY